MEFIVYQSLDIVCRVAGKTLSAIFCYIFPLLSGEAYFDRSCKQTNFI